MSEDIINKTTQELIDTIKKKDERIRELENLLRQHGVFVMDKSRKLSSDEKIMIFMDYFHSRRDLYAERYYNKKKQQYGWAPVCDNSFADGCPKRNGRFNCFGCTMRSFPAINEDVLRKHFQGKSCGVGVYPLLSDHTCFFLAMDFDEDSWFEDMHSVYRQAVKHQLYPVMERSQSGAGGHLWFFFATAVKARDARRLGEYLIREAMTVNRRLKFASFDRMFPNQDYKPEEGAGNLIALPLRYDAFLKGNATFIDEQEQAIPYPIEYLASRKKITAEEMDAVLSTGWEQDYFFENDQLRLFLHTDLKYSHEIKGQITSCIRLEKAGMNAATINILCRCASMYNPKYYEMQRLHKAIYIGSDITRVLSYYEEDDRYLYLPRGILPVIQKAMPETVFHLDDKTEKGRTIDVLFKETLREEQKAAAESLLKYEMGILQAAPGFGKTVVAIYLISHLKVNTLILVDNKELQMQWEERIEKFLDYPHATKKKDRFVCRYGSQSKKMNGYIDIAMVRTLKNADDLDAIGSVYGLTIIDECHHVACDSFLHVMRHIRSRYIFGLSATPKRDDGLFKVITMYCGPIRSRIGRENIRSGYLFKQYLVPRYTNHYALKEDLTYVEMCSELMQDQVRNFQIVKDILQEYRNSNNIIVLTERVEHLDILFSMLEKACNDVYLLSGSVKKKERKTTLDAVRTKDKYVLLATSKLLGEGFDLPSLNCLFLVLPISSDTRITQYTGRIHRNYDGKDTVKVYDYVDSQIPMALSMYYKRLKQYEREGYLVSSNHTEQAVNQILHDKTSYLKQLKSDVYNAKKEVILFVSSLHVSGIRKLHDEIQSAVQRGLPVYFVLSDQIDINSDACAYLKGTGGRIIVRNHKKHFIIIDRSIVWNCSFSPFSTIPADAFATRNESADTALEVIASIAESDNSEETEKGLFEVQ